MAIHEDKYVSYDGPLKEGGGWWIFTRATFGLAWSKKRTKLLLFLLWIPVLITMVMVLAEYGLREQLPEEILGDGEAPGAGGIVFFLQMQFFSAALLMLASGCSTIAEDLRYQTFQLYFSRPVERWEYLVGKFLGLVGLCSLVTVVPAILVGGLRAAYFARTDLAEAVAGQTAAAVAVSFVMTIVVSAIVLGLSSTTRRTGYAVLAWIGVILVPMVVTAIVAIASGGEATSHLWNLGGNLYLISQHLIAAEPPEVAMVWPLLILVGAAAAGLYAVYYRVHRLEGIA